MISNTNMTTTRETGIAKTDYDVFEMQVSLSEIEETSSKVRDVLATNSGKVLKVIDALKEKGMKVRENSWKTHSNVYNNLVYDREKGVNVAAGQKGIWTCSFQSTTMEMANTVYDKLISLDLQGMSVSPSFKVQDLDALHNSALKDAWAKVQATFNYECSVFGLDSTKFEISNYSTSYDEHERAEEAPRMAMAAAAPKGGGSSPAIELESGKATVKVSLAVTFARKDVLSSFPSFMDMIKINK